MTSLKPSPENNRDITDISNHYPSFDAEKTTTSTCHFHNREGVQCVEDLGKIIREWWWEITFTRIDKWDWEKTRRLDLIIWDEKKRVLDVTIYFSESQYIDNLKTLIQWKEINIGWTVCKLPKDKRNIDYWLIAEFPPIDYFITLASGCAGSATTLLKRWYSHQLDTILTSN